MHRNALHHQINVAELRAAAAAFPLSLVISRASVLVTSAGLSVARVDHVSGDTVMFRGADVVDGTPVLDIKPYIPYVDGGVDAQAPAWVSD